jgi:hypothetical protein
MRRMTRSFRTRKNVVETSALRDQFIRQLTSEAEALVKQWSDQFNQTLQTTVTQAFQGIVASTQNASSAPTTTSAGEFNSVGSVGNLLATGVRYLVSRPRTSRDTQESSRSIDANNSFKLSQAQSAAQMQETLNKGDKNT